MRTTLHMWLAGVLVALAVGGCSMLGLQQNPDPVATATRLGTEGGTVACLVVATTRPGDAAALLTGIALARNLAHGGADPQALLAALGTLDPRTQSYLVGGLTVLTSELSALQLADDQQTAAVMAGVAAFLDACERAATGPQPT